MAADDGMRPMEILLVEDSQSDAELAGQALRDGQVKCQLTHLTDGSSAVQFLLRQGRYSSAARPDLILLDLNLPGIDGRGVLHTIATDAMLMTIPVVIMTASTQHEDRIRSEALKVAGYLVKPVDMEHFAALVQQLMDYWDSDVLLP
ncbi:MAG: response regulator [Pirellulales bacterium]|nr:response regulator [Pirellulales bacterium]